MENFHQAMMACEWKTLGNMSRWCTVGDGNGEQATAQRKFAPEMGSFSCRWEENAEDGAAAVVGG